MTTPEALSDRARHIEGLPGPDQLREPNSTLQLANLIENFTRDVATAVGEASLSPFETISSANQDFNSNIGMPIRHLQVWAKSIDSEIVKAAVSVQPTSRVSLEQMVSDIIHEGTISDSLDLIAPDVMQPSILWSVAFRPQQWHLIKALFGIDTSSLTTRNSSIGWKGHFFHVPHSYPASGKSPTVDLTDVHDIMFQLISSATREKGGLKEITTPEDVFRGDERVHSAPTVIDGVSAIISTNGYGVASGGGEHGVNGCPNIHALILKLDPSFLASVRPLTEEEYSKYVPKEEQERWERAKQEYEQKKVNNKQAEEPNSSSGQGQRTENFRARRETFDPRDPKRYYKTLGVNPDADPEDLDEVILAAYRRLAQKYHADTGGDTASHERMVEINLAYEFLSKDENRKNYGRHN